MEPERRRRRILSSSAGGAQPPTHHGPLEAMVRRPTVHGIVTTSGVVRHTQSKKQLL